VPLDGSAPTPVDIHAAHRSWQRALPVLDDLHHPDADVLRARLTEQPPAS
jgi:hypothetical protein